ncbi:MAG: hypothetical protein WBD18_00710 [Phycisphaerae bacterium]
MMKELLKRHAFLLALGGGVVVLAAAVVLTVYFVGTVPGGRVKKQLQRTKLDAEDLLAKPLYGQNLIKEIAKKVKERQGRYDELLNCIRKLGREEKKPLVPGLFPVSTDVNLRHSFKAEYDAALRGFMARLKAVQPTLAENLAEADRPAEERKFEQATMYAHEKLSFLRPDWVDKAEAPPLEACQEAQEDLWLMEDLVNIIAKMNEDLGGPSATVRDVPIKELMEILIGGPSATMEGMKVGGTTRYRPPAAPGQPPGSAPTLTGRYSQPGLYHVLPFRLVVVADSRKAGELLRRLKGTESFLNVEAWHMKPVMDRTVEGSKAFLAKSRQVYGPGGVVLLEVVGESLVFQLPGGRVTNPLLPETPPPAPPAEG